MENRSLESFLNQNKELISKLDDSTRKISSLEETISAANHRSDLTKLNIRNFNMDGMGKFQNENFKKENK